MGGLASPDKAKMGLNNQKITDNIAQPKDSRPYVFKRISSHYRVIVVKEIVRWKYLAWQKVDLFTPSV